MLTLVNISETPPSPLSVNVIYTRPLRRGGGVQETAIRPFGHWELLSIRNILSVSSEPERAAEARSVVVASCVKDLTTLSFLKSQKQANWCNNSVETEEVWKRSGPIC